MLNECKRVSEGRSRAWLLFASFGFALACDKAESDDPTGGESDDPPTGAADTTAESGDAQWPESCAAHATQAACDAVTGQYGCVWTEILELAAGEDACETTVVRSECIAFENQGNGCSYGEPPESCGEEIYPPHWYRDGAGGTEYMADLCERLPVGWSQCWAQGGDPAECECVCLDAA